ncbi:uncharacterized protein ASPGLDRAFT_31098 [Aspergillus glaucus CBS 516.65]|uniref:Uncharacterized protein n=1 Tax=Aspergillus glaucus CBS 516.65 TaxID=1160497 RepID=A0A1L9VZR2_ASPGL|nr:hypothetical protein ASPGLDRAFT_31098 [Aspergillus glaucus CBS 516.65]OJJ89401.1 hypothetical protein ASPGLDRAFT_31098 [Aspergillus glaucus CBS 516.65]
MSSSYIWCMSPIYLQPKFTPTEKEVLKEYGNWANFMACYNLSPGKDNDTETALMILDGLTYDVDESEDDEEGLTIRKGL